MKKISNTDKGRLLELLQSDIANCLYMYADIYNYDVDNQDVSVWLHYETDDVFAVVLKYFNSFQVYATEKFQDFNLIDTLIKTYMPMGISGRADLIRELSKNFAEIYNSEYGVVFKGKDINREKLEQKMSDCDCNVELACAADAHDIAELICLDHELGELYTIDSLSKELADRIKTGTGRSYIIRDNGKIVGHNATYAECDRFVVVSGLMVHPDYRSTDYAYWLDIKSSLEFMQEGKNRYFMALKRKIIKMHSIVGSIEVAKYGRMSLIDKKN